MATKTATKDVLKKEQGILYKEISSLKNTISAYKAERKSNWQSFKKKTNEELDILCKSVDKLSALKKK